MKLPEPFCEFCRKKVTDAEGNVVARVLDYDELHAIECGIGDALSFAPYKRAWLKHRTEWHYYIVARGVTTLVMLTALYVKIF